MQQDEQYMSQPVDEMSESSYIKINKKFLQCLKEVNDMDDLSRFRQASDNQEQNNESFQDKISGKRSAYQSGSSSSSQQRQVYSNSPNQYKFYRENRQDNRPSKQKSLNLRSLKKKYLKEDEKSQNLTPNQNKQSFFDQSLSKFRRSPQLSRDHSKIDKKQTFTPIENTFQYYLTRKSHQRNYKDSNVQNMNDFQNEENQKSTKYNQPFSPQDRFSASNQFGDRTFNLESQMQRINYKKLLENEISKNKQLQRHIYKLQSKLSEMSTQYDQSFKSAKKLQRDLLNSQKIRKENRNRMKQLDGKLEGLKSICKLKKSQNQQKVINYRNQNKMLKQQNQKYRIFTETLSESIYVLKGHKPKKLQDIWLQWKQIFETFSKKKWTKSRQKSPNFKI